MLTTLRISNFSVVEEIEVTFGPGFTALTGETGAGKSILVDALGLLLGARGDPDAIRTGAPEASVEAVLSATDRLRERLSERGLPELGDEVSLRRVIGRNGRSKAYVNGALVTVGVLAQVMRGLVDISGQHENVGLFDVQRHRALLDAFGGLDALVQGYGAARAALQAVRDQIEALGGDPQRAQERLDFVAFQLSEIEALAPAPGEEERLTEERKRLSATEKLSQASAQADELLSQKEGSALELVGRARQLLSEAMKWDARLTPVVVTLEASAAELEDAARTLGRYRDSLSADPGRLAELEDRLDALKRLCRKHGTDIAGLLIRAQQLALERDALANRGERITLLTIEQDRATDQAWRAARLLSTHRAEAAGRLAEAVRAGLGQLAMGKATFEVRVTLGEVLRADGADAVEFFFSANPGESLKPLAKVVSGGEASRLLLALKRALAEQDACETYVLDEVDAGVSGATAEVVGQMVKDVSRTRQVLCVTHLPQVAAWADAHLRVEKRQGARHTASQVVPLAVPERAQELARMLSGVKVTKEALGAAEALLRSTRFGKASRKLTQARRSA